MTGFCALFHVHHVKFYLQGQLQHNKETYLLIVGAVTLVLNISFLKVYIKLYLVPWCQ